MSDILSWKTWSVCLIFILAVWLIVSGCSPDSETGGESIDSKHVYVQEYNKTIVKQFFKEVDSLGDIDVVNELLSPGCKYFDAGRIKTNNISEFIDYLKEAREPFDSIDVKFDNLIAEGNSVAVRYSYHSVLAGEQIIVQAMAEFLIEDGKIVEMWRYIPARNQKK